MHSDDPNPEGTTACSHGRQPVEVYPAPNTSPNGATEDDETAIHVVPSGLATTANPPPWADAQGYIMPPRRGFRAHLADQLTPIRKRYLQTVLLHIFTIVCECTRVLARGNATFFGAFLSAASTSQRRSQ